MAAAREFAAPQIVDLRQLRVEDLEPLLLEETEYWQRLLSWDFRPSADLVRRFIRMRSLAGYALLHGNRIVGFVYYICEERKGLIGDLYLARDFADSSYENLLLAAALRALWTTPLIERVESQLLMLSQEARERLPFPAHLRTYKRDYMVIDLDRLREMAPIYSPAIYETWHEKDQEQAARLIAKGYATHIDAEINDQYRSVSGARQFLSNLVQYPGCGSFFQPGSLVALDPVTGRLLGVSLASLVALDVGHVTQICVDPAVQGRGVGFELMRRSMEAMCQRGCRRATLTVTSTNWGAIRLYERMGFVTERTFDALVWDAVPERRI